MSQHLVAASWPAVLGGSCCAAAFLAGRSRRWSLDKRMLTALLCLALAGTAYLMWARYRASEIVLFDEVAEYPRSWPYPDPAIWRLNDWYDARFPAPPDHLKIHGELPRVRLTLDAVIAVFSTTVGFILGLLRMRRASGEMIGRSLDATLT